MTAMQILIDNLISILIAGTVTMVLLTTQMRSQHASIEQTASHAVKAKTLVFGKWVEHDILTLGANFGTNLYRFDEPTLDADGNTVRWTFFSDSTRLDGSKLRVYTRYRLEPTDQVAFQDTSFQLFQLHRDSAAVDYVGDTVARPSTGQWARNLWTISTLSFFRIEMLGRMGVTPRTTTGAIDVDRVDYVRVRFGVVPEYVLKPDNYLREIYWVRTLKVRPYWRPPLPPSTPAPAPTLPSDTDPTASTEPSPTVTAPTVVTTPTAPATF